MNGPRRVHVEMLMKTHGITSWRTLNTQTSSIVTSNELQHVLYNTAMNIIWTIKKDGDHPLLPFIAHIIGLALLCVAKRIDDLGWGKTKAAIEYFRLFHNRMFQGQWVDKMTDAHLPMSDNAKMVLFGSAKLVIPIRSLVPTTVFFYKRVKTWENHEDGIITMPGPTRQFFQPDVSDTTPKT